MRNRTAGEPLTGFETLLGVCYADAPKGQKISARRKTSGYGKGDTRESCKDAQFQPHMERSGMWGYKDDTVRGVLKERYILSSFQDFIGSPFP
ncbi:hypothetical protein Barb4_00914 [Bacteroidales bacterium Barb4]|nr:hypothetical protein Barb4_00914 [Bacteroidales bacterium Barb4]